MGRAKGQAGAIRSDAFTDAFGSGRGARNESELATSLRHNAANKTVFAALGSMAPEDQDAALSFLTAFASEQLDADDMNRLFAVPQLTEHTATWTQWRQQLDALLAQTLTEQEDTVTDCSFIAGIQGQWTEFPLLRQATEKVCQSWMDGKNWTNDGKTVQVRNLQRQLPATDPVAQFAQKLLLQHLQPDAADSYDPKLWEQLLTEENRDEELYAAARTRLLQAVQEGSPEALQRLWYVAIGQGTTDARPDQAIVDGVMYAPRDEETGEFGEKLLHVYEEALGTDGYGNATSLALRILVLSRISDLYDPDGDYQQSIATSAGASSPLRGLTQIKRALLQTALASPHNDDLRGTSTANYCARMLAADEGHVYAQRFLEELVPDHWQDRDVREAADRLRSEAQQKMSQELQFGPPLSRTDVQDVPQWRVLNQMEPSLRRELVALSCNGSPRRLRAVGTLAARLESCSPQQWQDLWEQVPVCAASAGSERSSGVETEALLGVSRNQLLQHVYNMES